MSNKWIIQVKLPNGDNRTYTTTYFEERNGRILFKDKFGQAKNFPYDACFIEKVGE